uniref:Uncharacterized protein n=1 Tax=Tetraselmis sp. GSL018 TaxID=582737 RepID=A0A061S4S6_9CHLO
MDLDELARLTVDTANKVARGASTHAERISQYLSPFATNLAASTLAFNMSLLGVQGVGFAFGVACTTPIAAPMLGFLGVGAASAVAAQAAMRAERAVQGRKPEGRILWENLFVDAALGLTFYKVLGGRFRNVLPSHLARPGAFAFQSILAPGARYCTPAQKNELRRMFHRDGCHTCGTRRGKVIGDHQPPNKVAAERSKASQLSSTDISAVLGNAATQAAGSLVTGKGPSQAAQPLVKAFRKVMKIVPKELEASRSFTQRYYPQCDTCSSKQGVVMRLGDKVPRRKFLVFHPIRPRAWGLAGAFPGLEHHQAVELSPAAQTKPRGRFRGGHADADAADGEGLGSLWKLTAEALRLPLAGFEDSRGGRS